MTTLDYETVNRYWNTATSSLLASTLSCDRSLEHVQNRLIAQNLQAKDTLPLGSEIGFNTTRDAA